MNKRKNPARAGRSEYRSREVREIRDGGPYYTVKSEWLTHPPTLTEGHFDLPEVREATVVAEHGREYGAFLGRGNFGLTYLTTTVHGPVVVKVAAPEALYGNRQPWSRVAQQNNMMHEAGVANELADMGYDVVPRTTYVELADGTPALVREYGDLADSVTPVEFYALETRLLALEKATGWRVQDDLLVLRRPDGSLFIGDVGIWQPPSVRPGKTGTYDWRDSSLDVLLSKFAETAFGQRDVSSLPRIEYLLKALSSRDARPAKQTRMQEIMQQDLRRQVQEALASREAVGIPSPRALDLDDADLRSNPDVRRPRPRAREEDMLDAIQHADVYGDQGWTLDDFTILPMGEVPLSRVLGYEDCAWLDVDPKDFAGMSTEERLAELSSFRGPKWAARAAEWLSEGVPPIVVIDAPVVDEAHLYRQIGDGRGRVNFALAMGLKTLPVVIMKWKHPL
jgi:hypothetical protein